MEKEYAPSVVLKKGQESIAQGRIFVKQTGLALQTTGAPLWERLDTILNPSSEFLSMLCNCLPDVQDAGRL